MVAARVFTELVFWQRARGWSKAIFGQTRQKGFREDERLVIQINDSSASVIANIAEGFGRGTQGEFVTFLGYALGSLNETQAHLCTAYDREFIDKDSFARLFKEGTEIRKMIVAFVKSMVLPGSGVKHQRKFVSWTDQVWESYERLTGNKRPPLFETETSRSRATKPPIDDEPPI
jgi:four helix bundle protein